MQVTKPMPATRARHCAPLGFFHPFQPARDRLAATARKRHRGVTAIELLVVIGILGILVALALPSFNNTIRRFRVESATAEITNALQLARSQAIATRQMVNVTKTASPDSDCTPTGPTDWDCGMDVYVDTNANGTWDTGEPVIKTISSSDFRNVNVQFNTGDISYSPLGFSTLALASGFAPVYVSLRTDGDPSTAPYANTVCIGVGGRVKVFTSYMATCP